MNNTVDPSTGTIQLKATFENTENALWPGQFVNAALTLTRQTGRPGGPVAGGAEPARRASTSSW